MSLKKAILAASILSVSLNGNAALTSYTGAGGVGLVYSSDSNVTWAQDANLFKTLYDANNHLISQIVSVTPRYNDQGYGVEQIEVKNFDTSTGKMDWWGAKAFVNYLNSIKYGGNDYWRLPTAGNNPQWGYNQINSELGQLYYNDIDALAYPGTNSRDYGILGHGDLNLEGLYDDGFT